MPPPITTTLAGKNARNATEEHAASALGLLERPGSHLGGARRPATSLIGRKERQRPVLELNGLVGDARGPARNESLG